MPWRQWRNITAFYIAGLHCIRGTETHLLDLPKQSFNSRDLLIDPGLPVWAVRQWRPSTTPATPEILVSPELNNRPAHEIPAEFMKWTTLSLKLGIQREKICFVISLWPHL
jgi:hypothetical protein